MHSLDLLGASHITFTLACVALIIFLPRFFVEKDDLSKKIHGLAFEMFKTKTHWHKRIVRSGKNTLLPYSKNPPNRILSEDDILFFDFGPVFEKWEADLGRTYVLGADPKKLQLKKDVEECWQIGKEFFDSKNSQEFAEFCIWNFLDGFLGQIPMAQNRVLN